MFHMWRSLVSSLRALGTWRSGKIFYFEEIGAPTVGHGTHFLIRVKGGNAEPWWPRRWRYKLALKFHHRSKHWFSVPKEWFPQSAFQRAQQPKVPSPLYEVIVVIPSGPYIYEFLRIVCVLICVSQVEIIGMLHTSTRNMAEWENILFWRNRSSDSGQWYPLFDPCRRKKCWSMVSKALAIQISNKTSPPVKTLISSSNGVVPSVSFPTSPTAIRFESPGWSYSHYTNRTLHLWDFAHRLLSDWCFTSGDRRYAPYEH
jgi:hypothetical protein